MRPDFAKFSLMHLNVKDLLKVSPPIPRTDITPFFTEEDKMKNRFIANEMKYGQIAGNKSINAAIYTCFEYISEKDVKMFLKKFASQPHDSNEIMHTFRELILGTYLIQNNFKVGYEHRVKDKTPDWSFLTDNAAITGFVELVNFHIDRTTEREIEEQVDAEQTAVYFRDGNRDNRRRLYDRIREKASVYKTLVQKLRIAYVIALYIDFRIVVDSEEIEDCLLNEEIGIFRTNPEVSGLLHFRESGGRYFFKYIRNPDASFKIEIPSGLFETN